MAFLEKKLRRSASEYTERPAVLMDKQLLDRERFLRLDPRSLKAISYIFHGFWSSVKNSVTIKHR